MLAAGLPRDRSKELASEVIAALDRRDQQAIEAMRAEEIARTPEEREAERRRKADYDYEEHRQQHQSHGMQRTRGPRP